MDSPTLKRIVETNLQYAEILLIPEPTDLELIDKDAGLGNIEPSAWTQLLKYFNSLHKFQSFKITHQFLLYPKKSEDEKPRLFVPPSGVGFDQILKLIDEKKIIVEDIEVYRYPKTVMNMRSLISSMLVTSGSVGGFRAQLQHSSITRSEQSTKLEDLSGINGGKKK